MSSGETSAVLGPGLIIQGCVSNNQDLEGAGVMIANGVTARLNKVLIRSCHSVRAGGGGGGSGSSTAPFPPAAAVRWLGRQYSGAALLHGLVPFRHALPRDAGLRITCVRQAGPFLVVGTSRELKVFRTCFQVRVEIKLVGW